MTTITQTALDAGAKALRASLDVNGGFVAFEDFPLVVGDIIAAALPHLTAPVQYRQREIDARLIAAAPDLLAALKHARDQIKHPDQMIDEAISKAEGGS